MVNRSYRAAPPNIAPIDPRSVTLCELYGHYEHIRSNDDPALERLARADGVLFPVIRLPYTFTDPANIQYPKAHMRGSSQPNPLEQLTEAYNSVKNAIEQSEIWNLKETLSKTIMQYWNPASVPRIVREHLEHPVLEDLREEESQLSPIKRIAWHPTRQVLGIVHRQDSVHVFDIVSDCWFPVPPVGLTHEYQVNVTCIQWNPQNATILAVGSKYGACIWRIMFEPLDEASYNSKTIQTFIDPKRPCYATMNLLRYDGLENISSMAWSPDGRLLAVASGTSPLVVVWDIALETPTALIRRDSFTSELAWSPNGEYLLQAGSRTICVWETRTWEYRSIPCKRRPHSLNWMPDGKIFFYAMDGLNSIHMMQMNRPPPQLDCIPFHEYTLPSFSSQNASGEIVNFSLPVRSLKLDPNGDRIAVSFCGDSDGSQLIIMLGMIMNPLPSFQFIGYIGGPSWQKDTPQPCSPRCPYQTTRADVQNRPSSVDKPRPLQLEFAPNFDRGALLATGWESGQLSFVPMRLYGHKIELPKPRRRPVAIPLKEAPLEEPDPRPLLPPRSLVDATPRFDLTIVLQSLPANLRQKGAPTVILVLLYFALDEEEVD
ncbi:WD40-repeat-containing domain protein [Phlyctochytrium arcticum]|nr:WD40-repeat-containing domain protein [Phlyctochytrium arcticum]